MDGCFIPMKWVPSFQKEWQRTGKEKELVVSNKRRWKVLWNGDWDRGFSIQNKMKLVICYSAASHGLEEGVRFPVKLESNDDLAGELK